MLFEILSNRVRSLAADPRLGARLILRRWKRVERSARGRLELAAVLSLLPLSAAIAAIAAMPAMFDLDAVQPRLISETLEPASFGVDVPALPQLTEPYVREARVQRGDTAVTLLQRLGVQDEAALRFILSQPTARAQLRLTPERFVQARLDAEGRLQALRAFGDRDGDGAMSFTRVVSLTRADDAAGGFRVIQQDLAVERQIELRSGQVQASLFGATDAAGVPDSVARQMVDSLESQFDFNNDLQVGDRFSVIYEALYAGGEYLRPGRLLAVEFVSHSKRMQAFWFADGSKRGGYYDVGGASMQRAFLRSPLEYSRINSTFTGTRLHPMFGYTTEHKGVDFQAPAGTKVRSIASGVVEFAGWQRGYGNVVEIRHDTRHSTLYAHLQEFGPGLVKDARISQGDLIGLVGQTGWATGPHLHFEVKINGNVVNPLTADFPGAAALPVNLRPALVAAAAPLREHLSLLDRIQLAAAAR